MVAGAVQFCSLGDVVNDLSPLFKLGLYLQHQATHIPGLEMTWHVNAFPSAFIEILQYLQKTAKSLQLAGAAFGHMKALGMR